ncbi:MAG TPA: ATP-binding protein [Bacteroidales bacterium]|nr:ATP-binding protein [Bacteroidales bacterium]
MHETNDNKRMSRRFLTYAILLLSFSLSLDILLKSDFYKNIQLQHFQERFLQVESELDLQLDDISNQLGKTTNDILLSNKIKELGNWAQSRQSYFFIFKHDSLVFWSSNRFVETDILQYLISNRTALQLSNGWCYAAERQNFDYKIIGLVLLKNNYPIENKYLKNTFNNIFNTDENVKMTTSFVNEKYVVFNKFHQKVLALNFDETKRYNLFYELFITVCLLSSLILFFRFMKSILENQNNSIRKILYIFIHALASLFLFILLRKLQIPSFFDNTKIFCNSIISLLGFSVSSGDILVISMFVYFSVSLWHKNIFSINSTLFNNKWLIKSIQYLLLVTTFSLYFLACHVLENIFSDLNINIETNQILEHPELFITSILIASTVFCILTLVIDIIGRNLFEKKEPLAGKEFFISAVFTFLIFNIIGRQLSVLHLVIVLIISACIVYIRLIKNKNITIILTLWLVIAFSTYTIIFALYGRQKSQINESKQIAFSLSSEHDKVAEYLLIDMGKKLSLDSTLRLRITNENVDVSWIIRYTKKKYFSGYWDKYDFQLTICQANDSVISQTSSQKELCSLYFNELLKNKAEPVPQSNFFYLKNSNGRITYLSHIKYYNKNQNVSLYIQLDSRLKSEAPNYPQILLTNENLQSPVTQKYSYAKYYKNQLSYQSGNFLYNTTLVKYPTFSGKYYQTSFSGYDHLFFKPDKDNIIILSRPSIGFYNLMVLFSYIFIFSLLVIFILLFSVDSSSVLPYMKKGFITKIRLSVAGIILLSFITIACITFFFIIKQNRENTYKTIREKMQTIYLEMESRLGNVETIRFNWKSYEFSNLENYLKHLSDIFYANINIYDTKGKLISTSRPELIEKGLVGTYMNMQALTQLKQLNKNEFTQAEWIGKQKYNTIYTPFINKQGKLTAYINLQFYDLIYNQVDDTSSLIQGISNFFVIMVLITMGLAFAFSENLIRPLRVIQENMARIKIGSKNEKIEYNGHDEIAELIEAYNHKVEELEVSAQLLAKSERETAWREMAKQVAHEIKNPLTPMKLSIQQLQRAWDDKHPNLDMYFSKVTATLVEQIENLSNIASEFSSFAQMPKTKNEIINLESTIKQAINLFEHNKVNIILSLQDEKTFMVYADKEQLCRVFINLITNSIQAMHNTQDATIEIALKASGNMAVIDFSDNGPGISDENLGKLFRPNFTTKTSGSGLGLAICKKIIDNANGSIEYLTSNQGAHFRIVIPLYNKDFTTNSLSFQ